MADARRNLAVELFNQTWATLDQEARTAGDDRRMLATAMGSLALWQTVGGPEQQAIGGWQVAHVACVLGYADLALDFAAAAHDTAANSEVPTWLRASTCEGLARAHAAAGHPQERDEWIARAKNLLKQVDDADDRQLIEEQLASIDRT
jgi:hypothetical protein